MNDGIENIPAHFFERGKWTVMIDCHEDSWGWMRCGRCRLSNKRLRIPLAENLSEKTADVYMRGWKSHNPEKVEVK